MCQGHLLSASCLAGLEGKLKALAGRRKMDDLSIGPVLTWTTDAMLGHMEKLLKLPGEPAVCSIHEAAQHVLLVVDDCAQGPVRSLGIARQHVNMAG